MLSSRILDMSFFINRRSLPASNIFFVGVLKMKTSEQSSRLKSLKNAFPKKKLKISIQFDGENVLYLFFYSSIHFLSTGTDTST